MVHPRVTRERLEAEWDSARKTFRPEILARLSVAVILPDGKQFGFPHDPSSGVRASLRRFAEADARDIRLTRLRPPDYSFIIPKLLVHEWMMNRSPVTTRRLMQLAGCTYPTAAAALKRLGTLIVRASNRRVELREFPRGEWRRLLAMDADTRSVIVFADRSGQPRTPEALLRRLGKAWPRGVAVGGVIAARHYYPDLDLHGTPRLDLSVHCPGNEVDLAFVERLDPGLKRRMDADETAHLALHFVRHADPLFRPGADGLDLADPVECLLDLHEARLESQAHDFLQSLVAKRTTTP